MAVTLAKQNLKEHGDGLVGTRSMSAASKRSLSGERRALGQHAAELSSPLSRQRG